MSEPRGKRERLPTVRPGLIYQLKVGPYPKVYVIPGFYPDGRVGEVFICCATMGTSMRTSLAQWAIAISQGLQFGMPISQVVKANRGVRSDGGMVHCELVPEINGKIAQSIYDAVAMLLEAIEANQVKWKEAVKHYEAIQQGDPAEARTGALEQTPQSEASQEGPNPLGAETGVDGTEQESPGPVDEEETSSEPPTDSGEPSITRTLTELADRFEELRQRPHIKEGKERHIYQVVGELRFSMERARDMWKQIWRKVLL